MRLTDAKAPREFCPHHVWRSSACEICRLPDLGRPTPRDSEPSIRATYGGNPSRLWKPKVGRSRKATTPEPVEPALPDDLDAQPEPEFGEGLFDADPEDLPVTELEDSLVEGVVALEAEDKGCDEIFEEVTT